MKKIALTALAFAISAGSALAADLPSRKAPVLPPPPPPPMWTGFYAGLNAGYNFGTNGRVGIANIAPPWTFTYEASPFAGLPGTAAWAMDGVGSNTQSGFIGGGQVGYNYQYGSNFLLGVEADIQGAGIRGSSLVGGAAVAGDAYANGHTSTSIGSSVVQAGVDWLGTVRGRVGYLWTPTLLLFGTGGFAYGGVYANVAQNAIENQFYQFDVGEPILIEQTNTWVGGGRQSQLLTGWTAGGGVEWLFAPNWSIKAEALYWDLGRMRTTTGAYGVSADLTHNANNIASGVASVQYSGVIARAGVNYHFNWAAAPVVAKY